MEDDIKMLLEAVTSSSENSKLLFLYEKHVLVTLVHCLMSQILDDYSDSFFYANESIKQMTSDKEFDHSLCVIQKVYTIEYNSCLMVPDYQLH